MAEMDGWAEATGTAAALLALCFSCKKRMGTPGTSKLHMDWQYFTPVLQANTKQMVEVVRSYKI